MAAGEDGPLVLYTASALVNVYQIQHPGDAAEGYDCPSLAGFFRRQARTNDSCTAHQARKARALFAPDDRGADEVTPCAASGLFIEGGQMCLERVGGTGGGGTGVQLSIIGAREQPPFLVAGLRLPTALELACAEQLGSSSPGLREAARCPADAFVEVSQKLLLVSSSDVRASSRSSNSRSSSSLFALRFPRFSVSDMDDLVEALREHTRVRRGWGAAVLGALGGLGEARCAAVLRPRYSDDAAETAAWGTRAAGRALGTGLRMGAAAVGGAVVGITRLAATGGEPPSEKGRLPVLRSVARGARSSTARVAEVSGAVVGRACAAVGERATVLWSEHSGQVTHCVAHSVGAARRLGRQRGPARHRDMGEFEREVATTGDSDRVGADSCGGAEPLAEEGKWLLQQASAAADAKADSVPGTGSTAHGFICPACRRVFPSARTLQSHHTTHAPGEDGAGARGEGAGDTGGGVDGADGANGADGADEDFEVASAALSKAGVLGKSAVVAFAHVAGGIFVGTQTMVRSAGAAVAEVGGAVGGGEVKEALDDLAGAAANSMSVKANIGGFRTVGKRFLRSGVDKTLNR